MTPKEQIIQDYRYALKIKGFTAGALGDFMQPAQFLDSLSKHLDTLDRQQAQGVSLFVDKMHAIMDKRYLIDLKFYFAYRSSNKDLNLISLDAELYDNKKQYELLGLPLSNLPKLNDILKELKVDELKKIRDQWEASRRTPPGKNKGQRPK